MNMVIGPVRRLVLYSSMSMRYFGVLATLLGVVNRVLLSLKVRVLYPWYKRAVGEGFDRRFSVSTGGIIPPDQLDFDAVRKRQAVQYQGTSSAIMGAALAALQINYTNYIFVDFGSRKGQALVMAALMLFKRVVGVELSRSLHAAC